MSIMIKPYPEDKCLGNWVSHYWDRKDGQLDLNEIFYTERCDLCGEWWIWTIYNHRPKHIQPGDWHFTKDTTEEEILRHIFGPDRDIGNNFLNKEHT